MSEYWGNPMISNVLTSLRWWSVTWKSGEWEYNSKSIHPMLQRSLSVLLWKSGELKRNSGAAYQISEVESSGFSKSTIKGDRYTFSVLGCLKLPFTHIFSGFRLRWAIWHLCNFATYFKNSQNALIFKFWEMPELNMSLRLMSPSQMSRYPNSTIISLRAPMSLSNTMLWARMNPFCHAFMRASNLSRWE